jgi:hypothetical protein
VDGKFSFIGRVAFTSLLDNARDFIFPTEAALGETSSNHSHMMVYGNMGGGKSHMLMALALQLSQDFANFNPRKRRIVVLPQASDLTTNGAEYMRAALMLAFANDGESLPLLAQASTMAELKDFCALHNGKLVYIIDQYESFEHARGAFVLLSSLSFPFLSFPFLSFPSFLTYFTGDEMRKIFESFVGSLDYVILGASANNETAKARNLKQLRFRYHDVYGGLTTVESAAWLQLCNVILSDDQLAKLTDFSGGVPLFLMWFVQAIPRNKLPCDMTGHPELFDEIWNIYCSRPPLVQILNNIDNMMADTHEETAAAV